MGILLAFLLAPPAQDAEFVRELLQKRKATLGDACRVFHSFLEGEEPVKTAREAAETLVKRDRMPAEWLEELETNVSLGEVSYLICTTLGVEGGAILRLTGRSCRYCYRECVARRLVKANGPHSAVSGRELLGLVGRIEAELER